MTDLEARIDEYLALRRAVGFKLARHERLLGDFARFSRERGDNRVTIDRALAWASLPSNVSLVWIAERLSVVRGFARWLVALDPGSEVPPAGLVPARPRRKTAFIYSEADITALLSAARRVPHPLRAATLESFLGLLAVTGMRASEAMALDVSDIDWQHCLLTVRSTKFNKTRLVPVHATTRDALQAYTLVRDQLGGHPSSPALFIWSSGSRLSHSIIQPAFRRLLAQANIVPKGSLRPRLHGLRHSFAVRTLLGWYSDGVDVTPRLPVLSTYLGHADPAATYWYLTGTPELLGLAAARLEAAFEVGR
jgi:integrase/recombinase XerD